MRNKAGVYIQYYLNYLNETNVKKIYRKLKIVTSFALNMGWKNDVKKSV